MKENRVTQIIVFMIIVLSSFSCRLMFVANKTSTDQKLKLSYSSDYKRINTMEKRLKYLESKNEIRNLTKYVDSSRTNFDFDLTVGGKIRLSQLIQPGYQPPNPPKVCFRKWDRDESFECFQYEQIRYQGKHVFSYSDFLLYPRYVIYLPYMEKTR